MVTLCADVFVGEVDVWVGAEVGLDVVVVVGVDVALHATRPTKMAVKPRIISCLRKPISLIIHHLLTPAIVMDTAIATALRLRKWTPQ
jgi:hypothetical protein